MPAAQPGLRARRRRRPCVAAERSGVSCSVSPRGQGRAGPNVRAGMPLAARPRSAPERSSLTRGCRCLPPRAAGQRLPGSGRSPQSWPAALSPRQARPARPPRSPYRQAARRPERMRPAAPARSGPAGQQEPRRDPARSGADRGSPGDRRFAGCRGRRTARPAPRRRSGRPCRPDPARPPRRRA
jgi:hypothetical protein